MSSVVIFTGPTLSAEDVLAFAPGFKPRGPAGCGDIIAAVRGGAQAVGIIDGFFDQRQPVWHKEILWAISQGCCVWGAASMGALRAAELSSFGMRGVGTIFELFHAGTLERDDEVTVAHANHEHDYRPLSVALINMRFTLRAAQRQGVVSAEFAAEFCRIAASTFYPDREYRRIALAVDPSSTGSTQQLLQWLKAPEQHAVDQKRVDALQLLQEMTRNWRCESRPFELARTEALHELLKER